jgi:hypothetical protein
VQVCISAAKTATKMSALLSHGSEKEGGNQNEVKKHYTNKNSVLSQSAQPGRGNREEKKAKKQIRR